MNLFIAYLAIAVAANASERWLHSRPECVVRNLTHACFGQLLTFAAVVLLAKGCLHLLALVQASQ